MAVVEQLSLGPIGTDAVVVDPSGTAAEIRGRLTSMGASCTAILVTHGHWDHILGVAELAEDTGAPVHMAADECFLLEQPEAYAPADLAIRPWTPEVRLAGDETLQVGGMTVEVRRVPGHSPAHLAYACDAGLVSGDVLFAGSVGRTDLPGANWETLLESIRSLVDGYPKETVVFPGHGPLTTLGAELRSNPFLGEIRAAR
jgi:glyoxylase-like metal-dependent hydrolase (beta-lactamase superfamily II)